MWIPRVLVHSNKQTSESSEALRRLKAETRDAPEADTTGLRRRDTPMVQLSSSEEAITPEASGRKRGGKSIHHCSISEGVSFNSRRLNSPV